MFIGIVADDLTGAADAVAPFAKRGDNASVLFFSRGMRRADDDVSLDDCDALALDTQSRDAETMRDTLRDLTFRQATRYLLQFAPQIIFKKIDSTLRGHLRVELDAMRYVLPERLPILCSAFPANGRTVKNGVLHLHGVPQDRTVRDAFGYSDGDAIANIPIAMLHQGVTHVAEALEMWKAQGIEAVFSDAETDADLDVLAAALLRLPSAYLPVGSAGLSSAIANQHAGGRTTANEFSQVPDVFRTGRVLIVVGSRHEVSRKQSKYLLEKEVSAIIPVFQTIHVSNDTFETLVDSVKQVWREFDKGQRVVIVTTQETEMERAAYIVRLLLSRLNQFADKKEIEIIDALIATGGETAKNVIQAFHGRGIKISGEIGPGVVLGGLIMEKATHFPFADVPIIVKSGGFGDETTLAKIVGLE